VRGKNFKLFNFPIKTDGLSPQYATKRHRTPQTVIIEPFPSAGYGHRIAAGFPPNSPTAFRAVNDRVKEIVREQFDKMQKNRRKMTSLHTLILKVGKSFPKKFVHAYLAC
jgi:hypothetical protein